MPLPNFVVTPRDRHGVFEQNSFPRKRRNLKPKQTARNSQRGLRLLRRKFTTAPCVLVSADILAPRVSRRISIDAQVALPSFLEGANKTADFVERREIPWPRRNNLIAPLQLKTSARPSWTEFLLAVAIFSCRVSRGNSASELRTSHEPATRRSSVSLDRNFLAAAESPMTLSRDLPEYRSDSYAANRLFILAIRA